MQKHICFVWIRYSLSGMVNQDLNESGIFQLRADVRLISDFSNKRWRTPHMAPDIAEGSFI